MTIVPAASASRTPSSMSVRPPDARVRGARVGAAMRENLHGSWRGIRSSLTLERDRRPLRHKSIAGEWNPPGNCAAYFLTPARLGSLAADAERWHDQHT